MKRLSLCVSLLTLVIAASSLLLIASVPIARAQATTVQVWSNTYSSNDIVDPTLTPGMFFEIDILATDLPPIVDINNGGINGFDITITYDPNVLKAVDADLKAPLCPAPECLFASLSPFVLVRVIDSPAGTTRLGAITLGSPNFPFGRAEGTGALLRVRFQVVGLGFTTIDIREDLPDTNLTGPVGGSVGPIPFTPVDGRFENRMPFALSADPIAGGGVAGGTFLTTVSVTKVWQIADFTELITLAASGGVPPDTLVTFSVPNGIAPFVSQMTVATLPTTPGGVYPLTITGTSDVSSLTSSTVYTLFVEPPFDFSLSVSPASGTVIQGGTVSTIVTATLASGATTAVSLSAAGMPAGVTAAFVPISCNPTCTSTLTFTASSTATTGTFTITITGTGSSTRTTTFTLTVQVNHDVGVTSASFNLGLVNMGDTVTASVTVVNEGTTSETFNVDIFVILSGQGTKIGTVQVANLAPGQTVTKTLAWSTSGFTAGTYSLRAEIPALPGEQDLADNTRTGANTVRLNAPPVATFVFTPSSPKFDQDIQFDARQSSDPDGTIATYLWDFGDQTQPVRTSLGIVGHSFNAARTYTVTLTVTDNNEATHTTSQQVTVAPTDTGPAGTAPLIPPLGIVGILAAVILLLGGAILYKRSQGTPPPKKPASRPNQRRQ